MAREGLMGMNTEELITDVRRAKDQKFRFF